MLRRFVRAYQRVQPLTIGELWAVAITLRIVLVENLRRARRAASSREPRRARGGRRARRPAARRRAARRAEPIAAVLRRSRAGAACPDAFAVQLVQAAARPGSATHAGAAAGWRSGSRRRARSIDEVVQRRAPAAGRVERHRAQRHHQHAADLRRRLGGVLRERQPGRRRAARRAATSPRWISRRAISTAARSRSWRAARACSELEVARARARCRTRRAAAEPDAERVGGSRLPPDRRGPARASSGRSASAPPPRLLAQRASTSRSASAAISARSLVVDRAAAGAGAAGAAARRRRRPGRWRCSALLGVRAGDRRRDRARQPRRHHGRFGATTLPGLELRDGVPPTLRTLVAVPTLLTTPRPTSRSRSSGSRSTISPAPDGDLHFALLSDWTRRRRRDAAGRRRAARRAPPRASRG